MTNPRSLLLGATAIWGLAATAAWAERPIVYSLFTTSTHQDSVYTIPRMEEELKTLTNGEITFDIHYGGVLANATTVTKAIADGTVDGGMIFYPYTPSLVPVNDLLAELPGRDARVSAAAVTETQMLDCPDCKAELDAAGLTVLATSASDPYRLFCGAKKITSLEDAKGAKLRATSWAAQIGSEIGMTPVNVSYTEIYESMQRGVVDCFALSTSTVDSAKLFEVTKYAYPDLNFGDSHGFTYLALNKRMWDGFSPEIQQAFMQVAPGVIADNVRIGQENAAAAFETLIPDNKIEIVETSPDLVEAVDASFANLRSSAIERANERGVKNAEEIASAYDENVEKWTAIVAEIGEGEWGDAEWTAYRDRLASEIYANLP